MKIRYITFLLGGSFVAGVGATLLWQHLDSPKPSLLSADEIVAVVRADAFLVSSRSTVTARVVVKSGADKSTDAPTTGLWEWFWREWSVSTSRDRLTAHVEGDVLAGFDLRNISAENVVENTSTHVVFNLGTPEFLGVIDNEQATRVISRETGWLRVKDETLLHATQWVAKERLVSGACRKGALATAGTAGSQTIAKIANAMKAAGDNRTVKVMYTPGKC